jgi:hypothetical protein
MLNLEDVSFHWVNVHRDRPTHRTGAPAGQRALAHFRTMTAHEGSLEFVETCWRLRSREQADRVLECVIYATAIGLELRAGYGPDDVLKSQAFVDGANVESADRRARAVAEQWLKQLIATPGFEQLPTWGPQD